MKSTVCIAAAILAAMSMVEASAAANLIVDGSFERPVVPDGSFQYFTNAQKFRNWTVVGDPGNVAIVSEDLNYCGHTFLTNFGTQFVDLTGNSDTATGLQQKIGWARYPRVVADMPSRPPLGGFNIGISSKSKHQDLDVARTIAERLEQLPNLRAAHHRGDDHAREAHGPWRCGSR